MKTRPASRPTFSKASSARESWPRVCVAISEVRMSVSSLRWGTPEVELRLELPSRMAVRLAIYDIAGRRRTTLLDRELPDGVTKVVWDGRDQGGARAASGVYFVRLTFAGGTQLSKIVILR